MICEINFFHGEAIPTYGTSGEVGCLPVSMTNVNNVMWLFYFHRMETLRYIGLHIMVSWIVLRYWWLAEKHLCHCAIKWVFFMFSGYIYVTSIHMFWFCVCVCACQLTYVATGRSHAYPTAEVLQYCVSGYVLLMHIHVEYGIMKCL